MIAIAIVPGQLYHVHGMGVSLSVIADHAATAITIAIEGVLQ